MPSKHSKTPWRRKQGSSNEWEDAEGNTLGCLYQQRSYDAATANDGRARAEADMELMIEAVNRLAAAGGDVAARQLMHKRDWMAAAHGPNCPECGFPMQEHGPREVEVCLYKLNLGQATAYVERCKETGEPVMMEVRQDQDNRPFLHLAARLFHPQQTVRCVLDGVLAARADDGCMPKEVRLETGVYVRFLEEIKFGSLLSPSVVYRSLYGNVKVVPYDA